MERSGRGGDRGWARGVASPLVLGWLGGVYGLAAIAVLFLSLWLPPEAFAAGEPWIRLGMDPGSCPGCALCGLSRAFSALSHGQLLEGVRFHPGVVLAWPLAVVLALGGPFAFVRRHRSS